MQSEEIAHMKGRKETPASTVFVILKIVSAIIFGCDSPCWTRGQNELLRERETIISIGISFYILLLLMMMGLHAFLHVSPLTKSIEKTTVVFEG
jgi:hypothetical protein